jgi:Resolvase, N terminal domain
LAACHVWAREEDGVAESPTPRRKECLGKWFSSIQLITREVLRPFPKHALRENIDTTTPTGKFMFHIIGAMAEFERDVIRERTQAGLEAARARGRRGGRPKAIQKIEPRNLTRAKELYVAKSNTIAEIMQMTGFKSRNTFYKYVVNGDRQE